MAAPIILLFGLACAEPCDVSALDREKMETAVIVSLTPVRESIARAIPRHLRMATAAGIGVFLTFIGLKNAGLIIADPVTLVRPGVPDYPALLMLLGLAITVLLLKLKSPFAFLAGILVVTLVAWAWGKVPTPPTFLS